MVQIIGLGLTITSSPALFFGSGLQSLILPILRILIPYESHKRKIGQVTLLTFSTPNVMSTAWIEEQREMRLSRSEEREGEVNTGRKEAETHGKGGY